MYLQTMEDIGANTAQIRECIKLIEVGVSMEDALDKIAVKDAVKYFLGFTFDVIKTGKEHLIASAFKHGIEGGGNT